jgi:3-oxoacyl-[acyl-carrier-protein] synthase III
LDIRQLAVAHLWGQCSWEPEALAALFRVNARTIKRDLARARKAGDAPRRRKPLLSQVVAQAKLLLAECVQLRQWMQATAEKLLWSQPNILRMEALEIRLLREEARLVRLLAKFGEMVPLSTPTTSTRSHESGLLEADILAQAKAVLKQAVQDARRVTQDRE